MTVFGVRDRRWRAVAMVLATALLGAGCSGDDGGTDPGSGATESLLEPGEAPTFEVEPTTTSGRLVGRLKRADRRRAEQAVSGVALRWVDDAFLGGAYPRSGFRSSFSVFTPRARAAALRDLGRTTNVMIGERVDGVVPTRLGVRVDLLESGGRAVTGTAHVDLRFRTEGPLARRYRVAARLMMTREGGRWRVFAYDVARARVDAGAAAGRPGASSTRKATKRQKTKRSRQAARAKKPARPKRSRSRGARGGKAGRG